MVAIWTLTVLAVAAPWPFGSVQPWATRAISVISVVIAAGITLAQGRSGGIVIARAGAWTAGSLFAFAVLQMAPLPPSLHRVLAAGSYAAWHPAIPSAAAVLGEVARPISVFPLATAESLTFAFGIGLLTLLGAPALADRRVRSLTTITMVAGGAALSVFAVLARALLGPRLYGTIAVPTIAPFGPFVSKNHFAGYVEVTVLIGAGLAIGFADAHRSSSTPLGWVRSRRAGTFLALCGAVLASGMAILLSLSRGGMVSLAAGSGALLLIRWFVTPGRRRGGRAVGLAVLSVVAFALIVVSVSQETQDRMRTLGNAAGDTSGSFRLRTWRDCLRAASASPLVGQGLGAFEDAFPRYKTEWGAFRTEHAENDYVEMLVEGGLVGTVLVLFAAFQVCRSAIRGLRTSPDPMRRGLGIGGLAAVIALLVHSAFDFNIHIPSNALAFAFAFAIVLDATGAHAVLPRNASFALAAAAAVAMMMLAATTDVARRLPYAEAVSVAAQPNPGAASLRLRMMETTLIRHLRHRPLDAEAWLLLAWSRMVAGNADDARQLGAHAASIDPARADVASEARRISGR